MELKNIHVALGRYSGNIYFQVENFLLSIQVGTPLFNNYGEWNILDLAINDYNPENNHVKPEPIADFPKIEITEEDLKYICSVIPVNQDFLMKHGDAALSQKAKDYYEDERFLNMGLEAGGKKVVIIKNKFIPVEDIQKLQFEDKYYLYKFFSKIMEGVIDFYLKRMKDAWPVK